MKEVLFENVKMRKSYFLNNGDQGYTFEDSTATNSDVAKNILGLTHRTKEVSIKTKDESDS